MPHFIPLATVKTIHLWPFSTFNTLLIAISHLQIDTFRRNFQMNISVFFVFM